jgi:hypothetical protein
MSERFQIQCTITSTVNPTYLSNVAARMYLPFGENFTNETGGLSSSGKSHQLENKSMFQFILNEAQTWHPRMHPITHVRLFLSRKAKCQGFIANQFRKRG